MRADCALMLQKSRFKKKVKKKSKQRKKAFLKKSFSKNEEFFLAMAIQPANFISKPALTFCTGDNVRLLSQGSIFIT